jgi:hypothetical protein
MYQKDYVLRMVEMLGELIGALLGLIKKGDYKRASEKLDKMYYDFLKQDAAFFSIIPEEELTHKLLKEHNYTYGHLEILAELFNVEAELELAKGNKTGCRDYSAKALTLFEFISRDQKVYSFDREKKMKTIRKRLSELS